MNEDQTELDLRYFASTIADSIQPDELALIESIMPDLLLEMMQTSGYEDA